MNECGATPYTGYCGNGRSATVASMSKHANQSAEALRSPVSDAGRTIARDLVLPVDALCAAAADGVGVLDVAAGVHRIGGKFDAYLRLLRRFREHHADVVQRLRDCLHAGDRRGAEEVCHALKGVSGNLSATGLFAQSSALLLLFRAGKLPPPADLDALQQALHSVLKEIDAMSARTAVTTAVSGATIGPAQLRQRLPDLLRALQYDVGLAETLLTQLQADIAGSPWQPDIARLADLLDVFDIDAACAEVQRLQGRLQQLVEGGGQ